MIENKGMSKEKDFYFEISLNYDVVMSGKSESKARQKVIDSFLEDNNIELTESEIKSVK